MAYDAIIIGSGAGGLTPAMIRRADFRAAPAEMLP